jgi:integrase/recombinase XerD
VQLSLPQIPSIDSAQVQREILIMEAWIDAFLKDITNHPRLTDNTSLAYANDLRQFVSRLTEILDRPPELADFRPELIEAYFRAEVQAGRSSSTLYRRSVTLTKFQEYLLQNGRYQVDFPMYRPEPPLKRPQVVRILDEHEIELLNRSMQAARPPLAWRDQALLALLLELGLPVNRLVSLNQEDVKLSAGIIRPYAERREWVALETAQECLQRYLTKGRPELNSRQEEMALFISQMGRRLSRQGIWQILRHWSRAAGLEPVVSPRLLRYTSAARLLRAGRSFEELNLLLGHTNPVSTRMFLQRLEDGLKERQIELAPLS